MNTGALFMVVVSMLSIAEFLLTWTGCISLRGNPKYVYSNYETNVISTVKIMDSLIRREL